MSGTQSSDGGSAASAGRTWYATREAGAGFLLLAVGALALWQAWGLTTGTARQFGPGMAPKALSVLLLLCGAIMLVKAAITRGQALERWTLRGPIFILGAAILFGVAIKPAGLLVAAPLAIAVGGLASPQTRVVQVVVFSVVMTVFCLGLFKYALTLPIPVAPWLIGY